MNEKRVRVLRDGYLIAMQAQGLKPSNRNWRKFKREYLNENITSKGAPVFPKNFRSILMLQSAGGYPPSSFPALSGLSITKLKRLMRQRLKHTEQRIISIAEKIPTRPVELAEDSPLPHQAHGGIAHAN